MILYWFRQDLRLNDNPAFIEAIKKALSTSKKVLPIYILDDKNASAYKLGGASRWWLHYSLQSLKNSLGGHLSFFNGDARQVIKILVENIRVSAIYWTIAYEPWRTKRDAEIEKNLNNTGIAVEAFNGSLLWDPAQCLKKDKTPYKVFTPFYRKGCLALPKPRQPLSVSADFIKVLTSFQYNNNASSSSASTSPNNAHIFIGETFKKKASFSTISELNLIPVLPKKSKANASSSFPANLLARWGKVFASENTLLEQVGEENAQKVLAIFLKNGLQGYKVGRNFPIRDNVSRLSPQLHFGEISPNQVWYAVKQTLVAAKEQQNLNSTQSTAETLKDEDVAHFCSELAWREFSYYLLHHFPELPEKNLQVRFNKFQWTSNDEQLDLWKQGLTGYPIIDAGMRQLWHTGYMHNRVRMIVASFLVKNLLIHWHYGRDWFWECLFDADLANNSASWQWVAGCGMDASPVYRIFNPILQGRKFDTEGLYIKKYVPELSKLSVEYIFTPWEAPAGVLTAAGIILGKTYPQPIVELKFSRERALENFSSLFRST